MNRRSRAQSELRLAAVKRASHALAQEALLRTARRSRNLKHYTRKFKHKLVVALALFAMLAPACAVLGPAETPSQRWYAAKVDILVAVDSAAAYCSRPSANRDLCVRMAQVVIAAEPVLDAGNAIDAGGGDVSDYTQALLVLVAELRALLEERS